MLSTSQSHKTHALWLLIQHNCHNRKYSKESNESSYLGSTTTNWRSTGRYHWYCCLKWCFFRYGAGKRCWNSSSCCLESASWVNERYFHSCAVDSAKCHSKNHLVHWLNVVNHVKKESFSRSAWILFTCYPCICWRNLRCIITFLLWSIQEEGST